MSHITIDSVRVLAARTVLSKDVSKLAGAEVFGLVACNKTWGAAFAKHIILEVIDCTGGETLDQCEVDCLLGKLSEDLTLNCS